MKKRYRFVHAILFIVLSALTASCTVSRTSHPLNNAEADASLEGSSKKGETEAEKEQQKLEAEDAAAKTLREIRRREAEEESRRIQNSINEYDKTQQAQ